MLLMIAFTIGLLWAVTALVVVGLCVSAARGDAARRTVARRSVARTRMRLIA